MTTAPEILIELLAATPAVSALVSDRISVGWRERGDDLPCIIVDASSIEPDDATWISGAASLLICESSVECLAASHSSSDAVAEAVVTALASASGTSDGKDYSIAAHRGPTETDAEPDGSVVVTYSIETTLYMEP